MTRSIVLAIDPGPVQSAWLVYNAETSGIRGFGLIPNDQLRGQLDALSLDVGTVAIEQIESFGMAVGREIFETVWWAGRFAEVAYRHSCDVAQVTRRSVKVAICADTRAKDANIRQALLDRFGGARAQGTKRAPGPLYGISKDVWSALAIAVTWAEARA
jgi:hypothetical protein